MDILVDDPKFDDVTGLGTSAESIQKEPGKQVCCLFPLLAHGGGILHDYNVSHRCCRAVCGLSDERKQGCPAQIQKSEPEPCRGRQGKFRVTTHFI